ncbi:MAG: site-specific DNA-methyltransferase [Methanobrevibacter sp.]|nr:site-specific DNA-methyltransferase [Candidatus Methanoflexus mossambicus]
MIYIDPPYNTGKDFIYKDNYKNNLENYLEQTGQVDTTHTHTPLMVM